MLRFSDEHASLCRRKADASGTCLVAHVGVYGNVMSRDLLLDQLSRAGQSRSEPVLVPVVDLLGVVDEHVLW